MYCIHSFRYVDIVQCIDKLMWETSLCRLDDHTAETFTCWQSVADTAKV